MWIGHAETKIFPLPGATYGAPLPVYFQPQFLFNKATNAFHHSIRCPLASDKDDTVISVPDKAETTLFKLFIQFINEWGQAEVIKYLCQTVICLTPQFIWLLFRSRSIEAGDLQGGLKC